MKRIRLQVRDYALISPGIDAFEYCRDGQTDAFRNGIPKLPQHFRKPGNVGKDASPNLGMPLVIRKSPKARQTPQCDTVSIRVERLSLGGFELVMALEAAVERSRTTWGLPGGVWCARSATAD